MTCATTGQQTAPPITQTDRLRAWFRHPGVSLQLVQAMGREAPPCPDCHSTEWECICMSRDNLAQIRTLL